MLKVPTPFPFSGSICYFDDQGTDGNDTVEKARIQRDNGDGTALISIESRRFPGEVASGNRTIEFALLRPTEQAEPVVERQVSQPERRRRRQG